VSLCRSSFAVAAALVALGGCGDDDNDRADPTTSTEETTVAPPAPVDEGCNQERPHRAERPGRLAGAFTACANDDATSLEVTNTSQSLVLQVRAGDSTAPTMSVEPQEGSSLGAQAVAAAVPSLCGAVSASGPCRLVPGATLVADGQAAFAVFVDVDIPATAAATAATSLAGYAEALLQTRASRYVTSFTNCTNAVAGLSRKYQFVDDAVRAGARTSACINLISSIAADAREPAPAPTAVGEDLLRSAGGFTKSLRQDLKILAAIRIATALR
jgi:hypothetical protein